MTAGEEVPLLAAEEERESAPRVPVPPSASEAPVKASKDRVLSCPLSLSPKEEEASGLAPKTDQEKNEVAGKESGTADEERERDDSKEGMSDWRTGLFECCNDTDICCLGLWCPCILFDNTVALLNSSVSFATDASACPKFLALQLVDLRLCQLGLSSVHLLPFLTWRTRARIRHQLHLKGHGRCFLSFASWALCSEDNEDGPVGEECERVCDFAVHYCCLPCALCQEAQEVRRRLSWTAPNLFKASPLVPPTQQSPISKE